MYVDMQSRQMKTAAAILFVLALFFLVAGIVITPERLIEWGPMRQSLCSDRPTVRPIAHLEVLLFRVFCFIFSALLIVGTLMGKRILNSSLVGRIYAHKINNSSICSDFIAPFNRSFVIIIICLILTGLYILFGSSMMSPELQRLVIREDGIFAWISVLALLACSISFAILSFRTSAAKSYVVMCRLFAIGFFLMAGEEISWGQRVFGITTPEMLGKINVQNEINLHNSLGYAADHLFIAGVFIYGFFCPVLARISLFSRKLFDWMGLPLPTLGLAAGFLVISAVHEWTVCKIFPIRPYQDSIAELRELLTAIAFCLLAYEAWHLLGKRKRPT